MAEFSAADAAFTGFRIVAARPWVVPVWAALQFAFSLAATAFLAFSGGTAFDRMSQMSLQPVGQDPSAAIGLMETLAPTYAALFLSGLVYYAVLFAAMNRAVFSPEQSRFAYLRLANDELRQLGLLALLSALALGVYFAVFVVAAIVVVLVSLATGSGAAIGLTLAIVIPALICAYVFLGVRISLASPMTFVTRRIDLAGAWRLSRGRFWILLGAYLVAFALSFVVLALSLAIAVAAVAVLGGLGALGGIFAGPASSLSSVLTPARLTYLAIIAIGEALRAPVWMTPPATIYRVLGADRAAAHAFG